MSKDKPPFEPDPDAERTVIRPNPGGRRDNLPPAPQAAAPQDLWGGQRQSPGAAAQEPVQGFGAPPNRPAQQQEASGADIALNTSAETGGSNPILEAAIPLLIRLSNVRIARSLPQVAPLIGTVAQAIETFQAALHARNTPEAQVRSAK